MPTLQETQWLLTEKYAGIETPAYLDDLARLAEGEPLAYLIGHAPFLSTTVHLDSRPLIPRPESEYWTLHAIEEMRARHTHLRVLDLCAGSGAIGVAVLAALPNVLVDFVEIDAAHHDTIDTNIRTNSVDPARARIFGGDLFSDIPGDTRYDFILSNPPYIDPTLAERVEASVALHEPHRALFGGEGGMEIIKRILQEAPAYLTEPGVLYLEHEPEQRAQIHPLAATSGYLSSETHSDQYGVERFTRLSVSPVLPRSK